MLNNHQLLANRCITPDGTVLQSMNRHDFVCHTDTITGEFYFTDGGINYIRRSVNKVPAISADVWVGDKHEVIREAMRWGTYGKNGDKPLQYVKIKDLTDEHIDAILRTQLHLSLGVINTLIQEIDYRKLNNIYIKESND